MIIDLIGKRFERLIVIKRMNNNQWGNIYWLCKCDCGKEKIIRGSHLISGKIKSCGCLNKEKTVQRFTKHGHNQRNKISRTYRVWVDMIQRCINPNTKYYYNYGGRGIKVCKRWRKFENFLEDMGETPTGYQIDRINNNGDYHKSNCHWVTPKQNSRNRNNNHLETYSGKTQCLAAWAEEIGINIRTFDSRLRSGWSIKRALNTPVQKE